MFFSLSNKQLTAINEKTWSRGTNSRLPFGVNLNLYLSNGDFFSPLRSNIPRSLCKS